MARLLAAPIVIGLVAIGQAALAEDAPSGSGCPAGRPLNVSLDVGHSSADPGATSAWGRPEYEFNRRFVRELVERARSHTSLVLTVINPAGGRISLKDRIRLAEAARADVLVSIHHDSVNDRYMRTTTAEGGRKLRSSNAFRGFSVFVHRPGPRFAASYALARRIGRRLKDAGLMQSLHHAEPIPGEGRKLLSWELGIYDAPFAVLKGEKVPSVLLELGVIANPVEERLLETKEHRELIGDGLLGALAETCPSSAGAD